MKENKLIEIVEEQKTRQTSDRIQSFDALKLFAIFLVLWGHSIQYFTSGAYLDKPVYVYIYSFHMPLFMMISGYFASSAMKRNIPDFMKKKFIQLLLPCVSWGMAVFFVFLIIKGADSATSRLHGMIYDFWFLKSLFICNIIVYFGRKICKNVYLFVIISLVFIHLCAITQPFNIAIMYPCFLVGMWLKHASIRWQKYVAPLFCISLTIFAILLCYWDKSFWDFHNFIISREAYSPIYFYREVYRIAIGISGSLTFIFLFYLLFQQQKETKLWTLCCDWGKYTLGIYILQSYILETIMARYIKLDSLGFVTFNFIVAPLLSIAVLIVCVYLIKLLQKNKFISFCFLGK